MKRLLKLFGIAVLVMLSFFAVVGVWAFVGAYVHIPDPTWEMRRVPIYADDFEKVTLAAEALQAKSPGLSTEKAQELAIAACCTVTMWKRVRLPRGSRAKWTYTGEWRVPNTFEKEPPAMKGAR